MGKGKYVVRRNSLCESGDVKSQMTTSGPEEEALSVPVVKGDFNALPQEAKTFIAENVALCKPRGVYICDGSQEEAEELTEKLIQRGTLEKLNGMDNCYVARTDPADVARVESKTFIVTKEKYTSVPHVQEGERGILGQWMGPEDATQKLGDRFPGCMTGNNMYVIPFCMGPLGSPLSKIGVQLTDFSYVVLSMRVMTRVSPQIWDAVRNGEEFVKCVHSVGCPRPLNRELVNNWPCDPEKILITHFPDERLIMSYGSGYGGNSLLGKKCFALRIASRMAMEEGWLAEHMLIMSVTNPAGEEKFVAAAFPSACGKTNLAMLQPSLPGWKVQCVGDDIAWMRFDKEGRLRAINPEAGFFGVAPGTNMKTNPMAVETFQKNSIFTNVGVTDDGKVYWEGMEKETDSGTSITTWLSQQNWRIGDGGKAAHPNSRFCCPASQCPIIHPKWEDPEGVVIEAIIFGGRRPQGVPLVVEAFNWEHGVMMGAALKSEATAAAEHRGKQIMHDPMAMRPFMGYNFGNYLQHWLNLKQDQTHKLPKVFHVNWFRVDEDNKFLWPGFGENIRVLDWICRRVDGQEQNTAVTSPIGLVPSPGSLDLTGLEHVDMEELMSVPQKYWTEDMVETQTFFEKQVGEDLPSEIREQVQQQMQRVQRMQENKTISEQ